MTSLMGVLGVGGTEVGGGGGGGVGVGAGDVGGGGLGAGVGGVGLGAGVGGGDDRSQSREVLGGGDDPSNPLNETAAQPQQHPHPQPHPRPPVFYKKLFGDEKGFPVHYFASIAMLWQQVDEPP